MFIASAKNKISNFTQRIRGILPSKEGKKIFLQESLDKKLVQNLSESRFPSPKQLRQLPQFLSVKEKRVIKILSSLIFICLIFLTANFYLNHIQIVPAQAGSYTEGVVGNPQYINPLFSQVNDVDADLVKLIFSGLLKYDSLTGEITPDLAEGYEISDDQKTYTFYLRDNLKWQDNEPLTIDDVIFTVELARYKETKSPLGVSFKGVTIEKINDKTIKFTLTEPYAPFLSVLTFGILPKHIWEDVNLANINLAEYNLKPIGSGPYQVVSRILDKEGNIKSYLLTVNKKYYAKQPFIENLTLKFFSGYNEAVQALRTREIQGLSFIPVEMMEGLDTKEHLNKYPIALPQYVSVFLNQDGNEFLKDKNIREALTLAINKNELIKNALGEKGKTIDSPFLSDEWMNTELEKDSFNPEKARELIEQSKFTKTEDDQFYKKEVTENKETTEKELSIKITSVNSVKNALLTEEIKKYWEQIGIKAEVNLLDAAEIKKSIEEKNYEALLYGEIIGFDPDPYPFWHSSQIESNGLNLAKFSNKEADKLLEEARISGSNELRKEKYLKFQEILYNEKPAIFLYQPAYDYMIDKGIKGAEIAKVNIPSDRFSNITDWYIKTKKEFNW